MLRASLSTADTILWLNRFDCRCSRKLLLSLGFREVGVHEKHAGLDGLWRDVVVVELLIPANV
jgi:L-amino acid N-acyltransferase YncA